VKKVLSKIKAKFSGKRAALLMAISALAGVLVVGGASADETGSGVQAAVTGALANVQSESLSMISAVLPYALAIVGSVLVVTIGIRVFKKISGR